MTDGNLLRTGSAWLQQQRDAHCTSPVEYRASGQTFTVNATYGKTDYQVVDESGLTTGSHVVDFLILADSLPPESPEPPEAPKVEPKVGDIIAADGRKHEVMALGEDFRGWRWSDPYRTTFRIHTRDIGPDV